MDYESFGEHQWEDTGIFEFLKVVPEMLMRHPDTSFKTATETVEAYDAAGEYDVPDILTWADTERDLTAWIGNDIQRDAIKAAYGMEEDVMKTRKRDLIETWRKLQTSDNFYYMCTKWSNDGDVHAYFSPYKSPYDAYINYMNALSDLKLRVAHVLKDKEAVLAAAEQEVEETKEATPEPPDQTDPPPNDDAEDVPVSPPPNEPDPGFFKNAWDRLKKIFPVVSPERKST